MAFTRIIITKQMGSAAVPARSHSVAQFQPYARIRKYIADVMSVLPVLCHNPELSSYKAIAYRDPTAPAGFPADRLKECAPRHRNADCKQKLNGWIEQIFLEDVHNAAFHAFASRVAVYPDAWSCLNNLGEHKLVISYGGHRSIAERAFCHIDGDRSSAASMTISFVAQIRPLFRHNPDVDTMKGFGLDLSSYEDVRSQATEIYARLEDGSMPCDGAWPARHIALFKQWMEEGMAP